MLPFKLRLNPPLGEASRRLKYFRGTRILLPLAVLIVFIVVSTLGYCRIQPEFDWLDALYMTLITITTAGHREVHPLSATGKLWTMLVLLGGVLSGAVVLSMIVAMIVEGQVRRILGRRQLERKTSALSGHVIVCGYGRMGALVADELVAAKQQVVVVDSSAERTEAAERAGILYVLGDASDEATLRAVGISQANVLVAALTSDAENVFVILSARQMNPTLRIIGRAQDRSAQKKLLKAGATRVICPQIIGASRMADIVLRPAVVDFVEMAHRGVDLEMDQLELGPQCELVGRTLEELALPRRIGVHVVAVRRANGEAIYQPTPDLRLAVGDTVILIGQRGVASSVQELQLGGD